MLAVPLWDKRSIEAVQVDVAVDHGHSLKHASNYPPINHVLVKRLSRVLSESNQLLLIATAPPCLSLSPSNTRF